MRILFEQRAEALALSVTVRSAEGGDCVDEKQR